MGDIYRKWPQYLFVFTKSLLTRGTLDDTINSPQLDHLPQIILRTAHAVHHGLMMKSLGYQLNLQASDFSFRRFYKATRSISDLLPIVDQHAKTNRGCYVATCEQ